MGEKDVIFNPMIDEPTGIADVNRKPRWSIIEKIGPGVNVMRDADGEIIGLYDDLGNPIAQ